MRTNITVIPMKRTVSERTTERVKDALRAIQRDYQYKEMCDFSLDRICRKYDVNKKNLLTYLSYGYYLHYNDYQCDKTYVFKRITVI